MSRFLDYIAKLPAIQRAELEAYLGRKLAEGQFRTRDDIIRILESYPIDTIGKPLSEFIEAEYGGRMKDVEYNALMDSLLVDLRALYAHSTILSNTSAQHELGAKEWSASMKAAINSINRRLEEYKRTHAEDQGRASIVVEDFSELLGSVHRNTTVSDGLILSPSSVSSYSSGRFISKVSTTHYPPENHAAGIYLAAPPENNVERDYNLTSRSTTGRAIGTMGGVKSGTGKMLSDGTQYPFYWVSVMLSDAPLESYIDEEDYQGYVVLLKIFFSTSHTINEITVDPFGKYRTYIRRIRYRPPGNYDDEGIEWTKITYVDKDNYTTNVSDSGYHSMTMRFTPVNASCLELMFNVVDFDRINILLHGDTVRSALLWDSIADEEYRNLYTIGMDGRGEGLAQGLTTNDDYHNRVVVDLDSVDTINEMLAVVKESLNIGHGELTMLGQTGAAIVDDRVAAAALSHSSTEWHSNEYSLGAYSVVPSTVQYSPSGTFISHQVGGYDTYKHHVRYISLETEQYTPALTSIEYSLVIDDGRELPIVPRGTTTYRERVDEEITGDALTVTTTFTPAGDVTLYKWDNGVKTQVDQQTPTGKEVSFTGCGKGEVYAIEYTIDTTYDEDQVDLKDAVPSGVWITTATETAGHMVQLPTVPYADWGRYNWDLNQWGYTGDIHGYYSDPNVLEHDPTKTVWRFDYWPANDEVPDVSGLVATEVLRESMRVSGWFASGLYHVSYLGGTGREWSTYNYMWEAITSGWYPGRDDGRDPTRDGWQYVVLCASGFMGPASGVTNQYGEVVYTNTNRANPVELFIDGTMATDKTSWKQSEQQALEPYEVANEYQYYVVGDTVYTNVNFDDSQHREVTVRFRYLTSTIKLKASLYTNQADLSYYTPELTKYKLIMYTGN